MKTAYRLMDCPINELDDLYSVNEYESDDSFFKLDDGNYYRPTEFVKKFKEGET